MNKLLWSLIKYNFFNHVIKTLHYNTNKGISYFEYLSIHKTCERHIKNKALLCYDICCHFWPLIPVQFLSDPWCICQNHCFLRRYLFFVLPCAINVRCCVPVRFLQFVSNDSVYAIHGQGGRVGSCRWKKFVWVCAQNYSGAQFIVPGRSPIPGPSTSPGPVRVWGCELHR